jgi:hypothetical protein
MPTVQGLRSGAVPVLSSDFVTEPTPWRLIEPLLTMFCSAAKRWQPVATVSACFCHFRGRAHGHRLPPVAPALLHKCSILGGDDSGEFLVRGAGSNDALRGTIRCVCGPAQRSGVAALAFVSG